MSAPHDLAAPVDEPMPVSLSWLRLGQRATEQQC
jgi:hypothetical protein